MVVYNIRYSSTGSQPISKPVSMLSPRNSVRTVEDLKTGGSWFKPPSQPNYIFYED